MSAARVAKSAKAAHARKPGAHRTRTRAAVGKPRDEALLAKYQSLVARYAKLVSRRSAQTVPASDIGVLAAWALRASARAWALFRLGRFCAANPAFTTLAHNGPEQRVWSPLPLPAGEARIAGEHEDAHRCLRDLAMHYSDWMMLGERGRRLRRQFCSDDGCVIECTFECTKLDGDAGVLLFVEDVTEQVHAAEQLVVAQESLRRQQRLRIAGELAIGIGHDVNNLLGALALRLRGVLGDGAPLEPEDREAIGRILRDGQALVERMQTLGRAGPIEVHAVDLRLLIKDALDLAESGLRLSAAEHGFRFRLDVRLPRELPEVLGDVHELRHAFLNLFVNARDAMLATSQARGSTKRDPTGVVRVEASFDARFVEVRVTDDGPGVAPDALPHVFDAFFTTKPDGTGIGLAMAKAVLERAGGSIDARNVPGKGACFVVRLRRADAAKGKPKAPRRRAAAQVSAAAR
jgi:signal transduction histidine kinase